jgi:hypothetical protein
VATFKHLGAIVTNQNHILWPSSQTMNLLDILWTRMDPCKTPVPIQKLWTTNVPGEGFELMVPVSEVSKSTRAIDRETTVKSRKLNTKINEQRPI